MSVVQLEDLLGIYPSPDSRDFQADITRKAEFASLIGSSVEDRPLRGSYFTHQQFVQRFLMYFDKLLLMHLPGTGKTCATVAVAETYKKIMRAAAMGVLQQRPVITKIFVLVKGESLAEEYKNQVVCKCTEAEEYELSETVKRATTNTDQRTKVYQAVNEVYKIDTYYKFAQQYIVGRNDDQIRDALSGSLIIIDEVHNLREKDINEGGGRREDIDDERRAFEEENKFNTYEEIHRALHLIERSKIMLLSATPMLNDVSEIRDVLNLILPMDNQMPENFNFRDCTLEEFERYSRGKVSYVRELDTGLEVEFVGEPLISETYPDLRDNIVTAAEMSEFQATSFLKAININAPFSLNPRQASNFVFPDGSYGSTGFRKYVQDGRMTKELKKAILTRQEDGTPGLVKYSVKFANIISSVNRSEGNCFVYSNFISGSGGNLLGLCFEAYGYTQFDQTSSVFKSDAERKGMRRKMKPYCSASVNSSVRSIDPSFEKKPRFAMFTSEATKSQIQTILELFNSYENRHGEYLKVIIGSPRTRDGINLSNVVQIHLVEAPWNLSAAYQAISRGIRATSHEQLVRELRETDPYGRVKVRVFRHCALTPEHMYDDSMPLEAQGVDKRMYIDAQRKDVEIKRIERMLKQTAVDCQINKRRNQRPGDVDYTSRCDYTLCDYKCYQEVPMAEVGSDNTTMRVFYSQDAVAGAMSNIVQLLKEKPAWTLDELYAKLNLDPLAVDLAVDNLVSDRTRIRDRLGFYSYIKEDKGSVFLDRDYPAEASQEGRYSLWRYATELVTEETVPLSEVVGELSAAAIPEEEVVAEEINDIEIDARVAAAEAALYRFFVGEETENDMAIINKYKSLIFNFKEPTRALRMVSERMVEKAKGRGKPAKPGRPSRSKRLNEEDLQGLDFSISENNEEVYLHMIYLLKMDRIVQNARDNYLKADAPLRIFRPSEGRWRDLAPDEAYVYNAMIQMKIAQRTDKFEKMEIYGFLSQQDDRFRIVDKGRKGKDAKNKKGGRICTNTYSPAGLFDVMYRSGIPLPMDPIDVSFEEALAHLKEHNLSSHLEFEVNLDDRKEWPEDKVLYFYNWFAINAKKKDICQYIQRTFAERKQLLVV